MLQAEMDDIIAINKNMPRVMKFGDYWSGMDLAERVNEYWKALGDKYGFDYLSVEQSSKGNLFFIAISKEKVVHKTKQQLEIEKYTGDAFGYLNYNVTDALKRIVIQLTSCDYENEAGLLSNNIAFIALIKLANQNPS